MSSYHFQIPSGEPLADILSTMPSGMKKFVREGFTALARFPPSKTEVLLDVVQTSIDSGAMPDDGEAQAKLGVKTATSRPLLASAGLLVSLISGRNDGPDILVDELENSGALDGADRPAVLGFALEIERRRSSLKKSLDRSHIVSQVLPSLDDFEVIVDVRLGFDKAGVVLSVPIALMHLDTDARGQEVWLQATRRQVQQMVDDLQEALKQMTLAENWLEKSNKGEK
jgi:hypothetical protein